jgi:dipeptidyl aminopeptidase/acylaminoacyl peptidase
LLKLTRRVVLGSALAGLALPPAFAQVVRDAFGTSRAKFQTVVRYDSSNHYPLEEPPKGVFEIVRYPSAVGLLGAYVTPDPKDGAKHPAIIWLTGGESNTVDDVWSPRNRSNDQSAAAYRKKGVAMMFPSLRGGNDNPGQLEGFYGEIDDVLAAAEWLAQQTWIDPNRIYLGGHSTGGSLALLVAEASPRFRATFSFGPVTSVMRDYGSDFVQFDRRNLPLNKFTDESLYRAPGYWLPSIKSKVFIIEGTVDGNVDLLRIMKERDRMDGHNPNIEFIEVSGADHFSVLAPANEVIARKIVADKGPVSFIKLTGGELKRGVR